MEGDSGVKGNDPGKAALIQDQFHAL